MKLISISINFKSGTVSCVAERQDDNGLIANVCFSVPEAQLLADAISRGRYTWDNEDIIRVGSNIFVNQDS